MKPTTAILGAVALTAFVLVLAGGLVYAVNSKTVSANLAAPAQTQILEPLSDAPAPSPTQTQLIAADRAIQNALQLQPNGKLRQPPELVNYQGKMAYEVLLNAATVYVDALDGKILANNPNVGLNQPSSVDAPSANANYDDHDDDHAKKDGKHKDDKHKGGDHKSADHDDD